MNKSVRSSIINSQIFTCAVIWFYYYPLENIWINRLKKFIHGFICIWLLRTIPPAAHITTQIEAELTFTWFWKYFKIIIKMCDFYLILLMSPKSYPDCHSTETQCQILPSSNFTLYLKISWQHPAKRQIKTKAKPLHSTIIFQATISRKERQKTDCTYTTVQNRFLKSNGIIFLFFPH